jgi:uncharacterized protein (DUF983 family)
MGKPFSYRRPLSSDTPPLVVVVVVVVVVVGAIGWRRSPTNWIGCPCWCQMQIIRNCGCFAQHLDVIRHYQDGAVTVAREADIYTPIDRLPVPSSIA